MQTERNHHAPLFLAVLSACLGLWLTGAPSHVQAQAASLVRESENVSVFVVVLSHTYKHQSPENAPQVAAHFDSHQAVGAAPLPCAEPQSFSQQSTVSARNQTLVVTRLPRASLEPPLA